MVENGTTTTWKVLASLGRITLAILTAGTVILTGVAGYVRLCVKSEDHERILARHDTDIISLQRQQTEYAKEAAEAWARIDVKLEMLTSDMKSVKRKVFQQE